MTEPESPVTRATIELLDDLNAEARARIDAQVAAEFAAQERHFQSVDDGRILLGRYAAKLMHGLIWLRQHPHKARLLLGPDGQINVKEYDPNVLVSPPLFETRAESLEKDLIADYFSNYYVVEAHTRAILGGLRGPEPPPRRILSIKRYAHAVKANRSLESAEYWDVIFSLDINGNPTDVGFNSSGTDSHKQDKQSEIWRGFLKDHPWLDDEYTFYTADTEHPIVELRTYPKASEWDRIWETPPPEITELDRLISQQAPVIPKVQRQLTRGIGWDYDQEVYRHPLGLVLLAGRFFGLYY